MGNISLDLEKAHLTRQHGDLLAIYTWVNDERALILIPAVRKNSAWYIVCESAAYKYDNMHYLARQAKIAAEVLGMEPSPNNWYKLAKVIHEGLPDLVRMPTAPDPAMTRATFGEMKLFEDGKLMRGEEIRVERQEGVVYG